MARILIYSNNQTLISHWKQALNAQHNVAVLANIHCEYHADALVIDSKKVDQDPALFAEFKNTQTRFLVIGSDWSEEMQIKALVHGAAGYCGEAESFNLINKAINSILKGDIWIQRHLIPKVIGTLIQLKKPDTERTKKVPEDSAHLLKTLSKREMDVAKMIRDGETNKQIAYKLNITERTVKAHLTSTFKKLNLPDRLHLALFLKEMG